MARKDRNTVELVDGKMVRIHRVNPLASGNKKEKEKLLALEKALSGERLLRINAKIENRQRLIARADEQGMYIRAAIDDEKTSAEDRSKYRAKLDEVQALIDELEKDSMHLHNELATDVSFTKQAQFELAVWALMDQHGMSEESAVRSLDAKSEIQICACLLGVDPQQAYPDSPDEKEEDEEVDHPLSEKQHKKDNS